MTLHYNLIILVTGSSLYCIQIVFLYNKAFRQVGTLYQPNLGKQALLLVNKRWTNPDSQWQGLFFLKFGTKFLHVERLYITNALYYKKMLYITKKITLNSLFLSPSGLNGRPLSAGNQFRNLMGTTLKLYELGQLLVLLSDLLLC